MTHKKSDSDIISMLSNHNLAYVKKPQLSHRSKISEKPKGASTNASENVTTKMIQDNYR